jgi:hypothetical protein
MVPVLVPHINGIQNSGLRSKFFPPKKEKKMVLVLVLKIRPASSLVLDNLDWNWRLISSFYYYQEILVKRFSPNYYDTPGQLPH